MKPILLLVLLASGCATYKHQRPVTLQVISEGGETKYVVAYESTKINLFLQKLSAATIRTKVEDGPYKRDVALGKLGTLGDSDMIQAISEGVASGIKKSQTGGL